MINHEATFRDRNRKNALSLHNQSMVLVKSNVQPDSMRVVRPDTMAIKFATDETRKYNEHGFRRRVPCDRTSALRRFPIVPKRKTMMEKYRFVNADALFQAAIAARSDADDMPLVFQSKRME